ncbi:MAG: VOC family protein [Comamonadaceae bacterium]
MQHQLRLARPVSDLSRTQVMYVHGLRMQVLGSFQNHEGFDGVMLGVADGTYHFEFTQCRSHPVSPAPTQEDLIVFYIPGTLEWQSSCADMENAGFKSVASFNPYWDTNGRTYEDQDGYRIVLQNADWRSDVVGVT